MTELVIANINKYIMKNHIKKTWIADALGINKMNISNILGGKKKNVSLEEILSILDVLDLTLEDVSRSDFDVENESQVIEDDFGEYIAFYGRIDNEKTRKTIDLVRELVEIIHIFKKANADVIAG